VALKSLLDGVGALWQSTFTSSCYWAQQHQFVNGCNLRDVFLFVAKYIQTMILETLVIGGGCKYY
jgi:hypothetical protein